jgi:hypothetical protein
VLHCALHATDGPGLGVCHRSDGKNADDYHLSFNDSWRRDLDAMVRRDRNAPSVLIWSIGNEIQMRNTPAGVALSAALSARVHELDPGSPSGVQAITSAVPNPDAGTDRFFTTLDVAGYVRAPRRREALCLSPLLTGLCVETAL